MKCVSTFVRRKSDVSVLRCFDFYVFDEFANFIINEVITDITAH